MDKFKKLGGIWPILLAALVMVFQPLATADDFVPVDDKALQLFRSMDARVSELKSRALELNRDLVLIEEDSFIPRDAQLVVFFSLEKKTAPQLRSLQVKLDLDGEIVANHLYTASEIDALFRHGKHRLYLGNLPVGAHNLVAHLEGKGDKNFQTSASVNFSKAWTTKQIELAVLLPEKPVAPTVLVREG